MEILINVTLIEELIVFLITKTFSLASHGESLNFDLIILKEKIK